MKEVQAEQSPQEQAESGFPLVKPCSPCLRTASRLSRRALRACLLPRLCCFHFCYSFGRGSRERLLLSSCFVGPHIPA